MSNLSRRSLVTSAAALPALAVPAVASAAIEPDPTFAVIAAHHETYLSRMRALRIQMDLQVHVERKAHELGQSFARAGEEHIGECAASNGYCVVCAEREARAADQAAYEIHSEAQEELMEVVPTTTAGVIALLQYVEEFFEQRIELPEEPEQWHSSAEFSAFADTHEHPSLRDKLNGEPIELPGAYFIMQNVREALQSLASGQS